MIAALALALVLQTDTEVLDVPVFRDAAWGVTIPRPFGDWVFAPATERGTTTVIFQPAAGTLSDQLWGALVMTRWEGELRLAQVAERRIAGSWRPVLGRSFAVLERESVSVAGFPAMHMVMTGVIANAVLEVEEYLIARGPDLIALQFRYPRGVPRDSVAEGYAHSLRGLRLEPSGGPAASSVPRGAPLTVAAAPRPVARPAAPPSAVLGPSEWTVVIDRGQVVFDLPEGMRAVSPGWLSSELVANRRRVMRYTPVIGGTDTTLYAVGRFRPEVRRVGRLTVRLWRVPPDGSAMAASDSIIAIAARTWARYWRAFGAVPLADLALVETSWPATEGGPGVLFLGADAGNTGVIQRELARTWWGGLVRSADSLVSVALPEWSALVVAEQTPAPVSDLPPGAQRLELARRSAGDARFREALRTLLVESRSAPVATADFLRLLGDTAAIPLRNFLR